MLLLDLIHKDKSELIRDVEKFGYTEGHGTLLKTAPNRTLCAGSNAKAY
jgi:hypothetical protein